MGILSIFSLGLGGCFSGQNPTKGDLLGEWKSQCNEMLILNEDNSFIIKNLRSKILLKGTNGEIDGEGKWEIEEKDGGWRLRLHYLIYTINGISSGKGYHDEFYIYGSGLLRNKRPYKIHSWDEDDTDYSVFKKAE